MATTAVLTAKGRDLVTGSLNGYLISGNSNQPYIGWGTNPKGATAASTDIGIYTEAAETRIVAAGTSQVTTTTTNDTYQITGTLTSSSGQTIAEVGVFSSSATTKPFTTTWSTCPSSTSGMSGTSAGNYTPANNTYIQDASGEVMQVTAGTGTTTLTVVRGANGSTAVASANGNNITQGAIPGATLTGGNMFMHATFTGLALSTSDSIAFTIQTKFT